MIYITDHISLGEDEIEEQFIRCSGAGGQHVNKSSTGVQLRFDVNASPSLPGGVRARLKVLAGSRLTSEGVLVISATRRRSQKGNREDALERLIELIKSAVHVDKPRRKTRVSRAAQTRRMDGKSRRSDVKKTRKPVRRDDY